MLKDLVVADESDVRLDGACDYYALINDAIDRPH